IGSLGALAVPNLLRADAAPGPAPLVIDGLSSLGRQGDPPGPLSAGALDDAAASGVSAINWTVSAGADFEEAVGGVSLAQAEIELHRDRLMSVRRAADIDTAQASARVGVIVGFQNGAMLGDSHDTVMDRLEVFHNLGVRVIQPTYNPRNALGDGCT